MNYELMVFGFYLSNNPITSYKLQNSKTIDLKNLKNYFDKVVDIIIYVEKIKTIDTKNKEKMMFITGSDELSKIDVVLFPKIYKEFYDIKAGDIICVRGRVEKRFDQMQLVASSLKKLKQEPENH